MPEWWTAFGSMAALIVLSVPSDSEAWATIESDHAPLPSIQREEALIAWSASTHREDLVWYVTFYTGDPGFGFIVPTPSVPTLHEADDDVLDTASPLDQSRIEHRTTFDLRVWSVHEARTRVGGGEDLVLHTMSPRVLGEGVVDGLDATILRSENAAALTRWIGDHGFVMRPALEEWIAGYVARGFVFTVFWYRGSPEDTHGRTTRAVRLTFQSERPFYPHAEPADAPDGRGYTFHLSLVSDVPLRPTADGAPAHGGWLNRRRLDAASLRRDEISIDPADLAFDGTPSPAWATVLWEHTRPRHDLYFEPDTNDDELGPTRTVTHRRTIYVVEYGMLALLLIGGPLYFVRRRATAREARSSRGET